MACLLRADGGERVPLIRDVVRAGVACALRAAGRAVAGDASPDSTDIGRLGRVEGRGYGFRVGRLSSLCDLEDFSGWFAGFERAAGACYFRDRDSIGVIGLFCDEDIVDLGKAWIPFILEICSPLSKRPDLSSKINALVKGASFLSLKVPRVNQASLVASYIPGMMKGEFGAGSGIAGEAFGSVGG